MYYLVFGMLFDLMVHNFVIGVMGGLEIFKGPNFIDKAMFQCVLS